MAQVRLFLSCLVLAFIAGAILSPGADAQSTRGWKLCNKTSYVIEAAIARPDGKGLIVEGWTKLAPGTCKLALKGPLEADIHFLYARSSEAHRGGSREWGGEYDLCIDPTGSFTTESQPDCAAWGMESRGFRPVLIQRRSSWNTTFTETDTYTLEMARAAGVQRLLEDAGVYSGAIDGRLGPRTRAAITQFLKDKDLPSNTSDADLIDLLEQVAKSRAREVGFTLCNRTKKRIWSAIARRRGDDWESRGWWMLAAGGCARVIDAPLRAREHFVYGEMEDGDKVRTLAKASDAFCVGRAKFVINGRDNCEQSAYRTALFASTPPPTGRKLVFEFFERDFARSGGE